MIKILIVGEPTENIRAQINATIKGQPHEYIVCRDEEDFRAKTKELTAAPLPQSMLGVKELEQLTREISKLNCEVISEPKPFPRKVIPMKPKTINPPVKNFNAKHGYKHTGGNFRKH